MDDSYGRLAALGNQLIDTHVVLLNALDDLREGEVPEPDLLTHCLAFCAAITRHHTSEDSTVFPVLAERHPELRDVLTGLEQDHHLMAGMIRRVEALAGRLDAEGAQAELAGLAALIESHFAWEEKRIVTALNGLRPGDLPIESLR